MRKVSFSLAAIHGFQLLVCVMAESIPKKDYFEFIAPGKVR